MKRVAWNGVKFPGLNYCPSPPLLISVFLKFKHNHASCFSLLLVFMLNFLNKKVNISLFPKMLNYPFMTCGKHDSADVNSTIDHMTGAS